METFRARAVRFRRYHRPAGKRLAAQFRRLYRQDSQASALRRTFRSCRCWQANRPRCEKFAHLIALSWLRLPIDHEAIAGEIIFGRLKMIDPDNAKTRLNVFGLAREPCCFEAIQCLDSHEPVSARADACALAKMHGIFSHLSCSCGFRTKRRAQRLPTSRQSSSDRLRSW